MSGASGTTRFLHDGGDLVAEYDTAGNMLRRYVHGTGGGDDPQVWFEGASVADSARRYLFADERGSVVAVTDGNQDIMLFSSAGKAVRFKEDQVRPMGRAAHGVRGISLEKGQRVISMLVAEPGTVLSVTENGYGKRTSIDEYPLQKRGGLGVITIKTSERNGLVVALLLVDEPDDLMVMTDSGKLIRIPVSGISVISRNTQGVRIMRLAEDETVVGVERVAAESGEGEGEAEDE